MAVSQQDFSKVERLLERKKNSKTGYEKLISGQAYARAKLNISSALHGDVDLMSNGGGVLAYVEDVKGEKYAVGGYCQKDKELKFHWTPPESV